jgi:hypothetical protein
MRESETPEEVIIDQDISDVVNTTNLDQAVQRLKGSFGRYTKEVWTEAIDAEMPEDIKIPSLVERRKVKFEKIVDSKGKRYASMFLQEDGETADAFQARCKEAAREDLTEMADLFDRKYKIEGHILEKAVDKVTKVIAKVATKMRNFFKKAAIVIKKTFTRENRGEVIKELFKTGLQALKTGIATISNAVAVSIGVAKEKWKHSHVMKDAIRYIAHNAKLATLPQNSVEYQAELGAHSDIEGSIGAKRQGSYNADRDARVAKEVKRRARSGIRTRKQAGKDKGGI